MHRIEKLPSHFIGVLILTILFTVLAYFRLGSPPLGIDDAHIFFTYGRHLAEREGFVYNIGGEIVEGFSSLAWVLIVAAVFLFTHSPEIPLLLISIFLISFAIAYAWQYIDEIQPSRIPGVLFLVMVYSSPGFIIWNTLTLMDTALWMSLLTLGVVTALKAKSPMTLSILIAFLLLTRPEAMAWGIVLITIFGLLTYLQHDHHTAWKHIRWPLITYITVLVTLICWRMLYFGYPLPNTYYAKVSPNITYNLISGLKYANTFVLAYPLMTIFGVILSLTIILLNTIWLFKTLWKNSAPLTDLKRVRFILYAYLASFAFLLPVWTGGDHFSLLRFYQPVWLIFFLPVLFVWDKWPKSTSKYGFAFLFIILLFISPIYSWRNNEFIDSIQNEFAFASEGEEIGYLLNRIKGKPPKVAVILAGGISTTYQGEIFDTMGLNHSAVAHAPGDRIGYKNHAAFNPDIFLQENPDLFISFQPVLNKPDELIKEWLDKASIHNKHLKGIQTNKQFTDRYQLSIIHFSDISLRVFINKQYIDTLLKQGIEVTPIFTD